MSPLCLTRRRKPEGDGPKRPGNTAPVSQRDKDISKEYWGLFREHIDEYDDEEAREFLERNPNYINDCTMHRALEQDVSLHTIKIILKTVPGCISSTSDFFDQCWPLHKAVRENKSVEIVSYLVKIWPAGLRRKNRVSGNNVLHYALTCSEDLLQYLLEEHPDNVNQKNLEGERPAERWRRKTGHTEFQSESLASFGHLEVMEKLFKDDDIKEVMYDMHDLKWDEGKRIALMGTKNKGAATEDLDEKLMPQLLSMVGGRDNLTAMHQLVQCMPELFKM